MTNLVAIAAESARLWGVAKIVSKRQAEVAAVAVIHEREADGKLERPARAGRPAEPDLAPHAAAGHS